MEKAAGYPGSIVIRNAFEIQHATMNWSLKSLKFKLLNIKKGNRQPFGLAGGFPVINRRGRSTRLGECQQQPSSNALASWPLAFDPKTVLYLG